MVTRGSKGTNLRYLRMLQTDNAILMRYKEMVIDKQDATDADQLSKKRRPGPEPADLQAAVHLLMLEFDLVHKEC